MPDLLSKSVTDARKNLVETSNFSMSASIAAAGASFLVALSMLVDSFPRTAFLSDGMKKFLIISLMLFTAYVFSMITYNTVTAVELNKSMSKTEERIKAVEAELAKLDEFLEKLLSDLEEAVQKMMQEKVDEIRLQLKKIVKQRTLLEQQKLLLESSLMEEQKRLQACLLAMEQSATETVATSVEGYNTRAPVVEEDDLDAKVQFSEPAEYPFKV